MGAGTGKDRAVTAVARLFSVGRVVGIWLFCMLVAVLTAVSARAQHWQPEKITILLGHARGSAIDRATVALAEAWRAKLGAPVVVLARGRAGMLRAAGEFAISPRDGRIVLAGDLAALALSYARTRPVWIWERTFEHLGVFAIDPAVLFTGTSSDIDDLGDIISQARMQPYPVAVAAWNGIENVVLQDVARSLGLRFTVTPVGGGAGFANAVSRGAMRLGFGRLSFLHDQRRSVRILAHGGALGREVMGGSATLDAVFGVSVPPVGRFDVITVHAGFQRNFPARYEKLRRSLEAAREDEDYRETLSELGFGTEGAGAVGHGEILAAVRQWWDAAARVAPVLAAVPAPTQTRGKLTRIEDNGRRLRYLGLDGEVHDLAADPEETEVTVAGTVQGGSDPLAGLKEGMICEIVWPSPVAVQASRLACK